MKIIPLLTLAVLMLCSCSKKPHQEEIAAAAPADALIERLHSLVNDSLIAFGHHDDLSYGYRWEYVPDSSDVKNVTGDYPAIVNWDLGFIEDGGEKQLDGVPFEFIKQNAIAHAARGGINTFSWHPRNIVTGGDSWDLSDSTVVAQIVNPGPVQDKFRGWVGMVADFIGGLQDEHGEAIPVVFRPWHEHTGSWFWWGEKFCSVEDYKSLWELTRNVFDEKGVNNVVWAYSPDKVKSLEHYMERYPGDEYVDIFGADVYYFPAIGKEGFQDYLTHDLTYATQMAHERGKLAALTETGCEALTAIDWYTQMLYPVIKEYPIAYITVWRNAPPHAKANHFYTPYKDHPAEADFIEFYNQPRNAFLRDIN